MIFQTTLEDYSKDLDKGIKKLNSYNKGLLVFALFLILTLIPYTGYWLSSIQTLIPEGQALNFDNFMISINKGDNFKLSLGLGGILFGIVFSFFMHSKLLKSQMFKYVQDIHPNIISSHKNIFKDHSDEAIDAFREERNKEKLLEILRHYKGHTDFIIENYQNLNSDNE